MKTEEELNSSEAILAHTIFPAGFILRKWLRLVVYLQVNPLLLP